LGKVIPFSEIESYLMSIDEADFHKGTILDTNVLISVSYDVRDSHAGVVEVWDSLLKKKYSIVRYGQHKVRIFRIS